MVNPCSACTYDNPDNATKCEVCESDIEPLSEAVEKINAVCEVVNQREFNKNMKITKEISSQPPAVLSASVPEEWHCANCTFCNHGYLQECEMCRSHRVVESVEEAKESTTEEGLVDGQVPAPTRGKVIFHLDNGGESPMGAAMCPNCGTGVDFCYFYRYNDKGERVKQLQFLTNPEAPIEDHKWDPTCSSLTCGDGRFTLTEVQAAKLEKILCNTPKKFGCDAYGLKQPDVRKYLQKEEPESPYKKGDQIPAHLSPDLMEELEVSCGEFRVCLNEKDGPYTEMS